MESARVFRRRWAQRDWCWAAEYWRSKNSVLNYETAIKAGRYVVVAHGDESDVDRPGRILGTMQSESATAPTA